MLYDYQQKSVDEILREFKTHRRVLYQLSTGGGKTFIFSHLTELLSKKKRIVILVDRDELVGQTVDSLLQLGVPSEAVTSRKRKLKHFSSVYVAMVETAYNRLIKNPDFFHQIDLLILDEAHMMSFNKMFPLFPTARVLGCTATPVVLKREKYFKCDLCDREYETEEVCCGIETQEWTRPFTLSKIYDNIVCGPPISELIEKDRLVQEISMVRKSVDTSKLKTDKSGDYTEKSQNHAFGAESSIESLVDDYNKYLKGKKVMIFTGSTKINALLEKAFEDYNAKIFDTVNSEGNRKEVVQWFRDEKDAILISTGVFTKGFDVRDVDAIVLYRATKSLSLYIQIVGRGARTYEGKFNFYLFDYGNNIEEHGEFSDPNRDWSKIFWKGIGKDKRKGVDLIQAKQCDKCGMLYPASEEKCPSCGAIPPPKKEKKLVGEEYQLVPITPMPKPSGRKIVEYAKYCEEGAAFAFRVLTKQILDLFKFYSVTEEQYQSAKESGELDRKLDKMIKSAYFAIIKSDLDGGNRKLNTIINQIKSKLDESYS